MYRTRNLVEALCRFHQSNRHVVLRPDITPRFFSALAGTPAAGDDNSEPQKQDVDATGAQTQQPPMSERRPMSFGQLQFLLQRRMPVNSVRLLSNGVRLACDERRAEQMVAYLGPWISQLTRPETLERLMPWTIADILRDLTRLSRVVGVRGVREALPAKNLQILANRLVVQGFDKLTPIQLARAAEGFATFRPWQRRTAVDSLAIDADESSVGSTPAWPSSDWVDELVDWLHNLKPGVEPWPRVTPSILGIILFGLARSNYKPRQPTFLDASAAVKAKLEEQLQAGYISRQALLTSGKAWNIWRVNPDEYTPGYWDTWFKNAAQEMETYVDSIPDPPSTEDMIPDSEEPALELQGTGSRRRLFRNPQSLLQKRRNFRAMLVTTALVTKNFNLTNQFNEKCKAIWEQRIDEHALYISGTGARHILNSVDSMEVSLKEQTREKLMKRASSYGRGAQQSGMDPDQDIDEFDEPRGAAGGGRGGGGRGGVANDELDDDFDDFKRAGGASGKARRGDYDFV